MYFENQSSHTSDHTLSHLGSSRVQYDDMLTTLQSVGCLYDTERNTLLHGYQQLYDKWMFEMWYVFFCLLLVYYSFLVSAVMNTFRVVLCLNLSVARFNCRMTNYELLR